MADPTRIRHQPDPGSDSRGVQWRRWLLGAAIVILLIIVVQNSQKVAFKILFIKTSAPLILLLLIAAVLGAVIGYAGPIVRRHNRRERDMD